MKMRKQKEPLAAAMFLTAGRSFSATPTECLQCFDSVFLIILDEHKFVIDPTHPQEGAVDTVVPTVNPATEMLQAANQELEDAKGWKYDNMTIICNDTLMTETC